MIGTVSLRRVLAVVALAAPVLAIAACNTIEGMGQDIQAAGEAITGTAKDTKEEIKK